jgi:hypothetical protein
MGASAALSMWASAAPRLDPANRKSVALISGLRNQLFREQDFRA